jgi:hypothetical protein
MTISPVVPMSSSELSMKGSKRPIRTSWTTCGSILSTSRVMESTTTATGMSMIFEAGISLRMTTASTMAHPTTTGPTSLAPSAPRAAMAQGLLA